MKFPERKNFPVIRVGPENQLNRLSEKRNDTKWIATRLRAKGSRFLLLGGLKIAIQSSGEGQPASPRWYTPGDLTKLTASAANTVFLGCDDNDNAVFAIYLSEGDLAHREDRGEGLKPLVDLRTLALQAALEPDELSLAAVALSLAGWHHNNICCGRCGSATHTRNAGWSRECRACGLNLFPRMDPAVIVLVTDGTRCLLGHHKRYAHKFYSTLAGFVEPGEDIEACVRREMHEETGVKIGEVGYMATQPWPFPHSLMIGCWAEALSTDITLEEEELWDARWFTRDEVLQMMEEKHPEGFTVPGTHSIAHALIRSFIDHRG